MFLKVSKSSISGKVKIPGSKSHTIRSLFFAALAEGNSEIRNPLISDDALSALSVCKSLGADIIHNEEGFFVKGFSGTPITPDDIIDVGNSGTTLRFGLMTAALGNGTTVFTGDYQIRRRQVGPLIEAINNLGGNAFSTRNNGMAPIVINRKAIGGKTPLDSFTSQYLSSMLIHAPLLSKDTEINLVRLNEIPYVDITLWWLDKLGIKYERNEYKSFYIPSRQKYDGFKCVIPGDFSSATFFLVLAAISGQEFILENLDMNDTQGDKAVVGILESMGAQISYMPGFVKIKGNGLKGCEIDMNAIPDALPAMAVAGCFAEGETRLVNVPQARTKETDRIAVMCKELKKLGADIEELEDGLIIRQSKLKGANVSGHDDHRVVMSLAIAGLNCEGETIIDTAEAMNITFPEFSSLIKDCGGMIGLYEKV